MRRFNFLPNLKVGNLELTKFQVMQESNIRDFFEPVIKSLGLIIQKDWAGAFTNEWKVGKVDNFTIQVNAGQAFVLDAENKVVRIVLPSNYSIGMSTDDATYKVIARHFYSNFEQGTVSVTNGSDVVVGTNTEFTKVLAINRRIYLNGTPYVVLSIESDTQLTLATAYAGTNFTTLQYKVGGYFGAYPVNENENLIYQNDGLILIVTTGALQANDLYLADVIIQNGWVTTINDKRYLNIFETYNENPKINHQNTRTRKITLYRPALFCSASLNADISTDVQAQIIASDAHSTNLQSKFALRFNKTGDDSLLTVKFSAFYTDTGLALSEADQLKWQTRLDIVGQANGTLRYMDVTEPTYDISLLPNGYYELNFKLKKTTTAFNLSIRVEEIYLTGNKNLVI